MNEPQNLTLFRDRLAYAIQEAGLSNSEFSRRTGLHRSTILNYLNGKFVPKRKEMETLASVLNVSLQWLMLGESHTTAMNSSLKDNSLILNGSFQERLLEALDSAGIVLQCELAQRSGLKESTISRYINGSSTPRFSAANSLAAALDVSTNWLLGYDVPKERNPEQKRDQFVVQMISKLRTDTDFLKVVQQLSELDATAYDAVRRMIDVLSNKP